MYESIQDAARGLDEKDALAEKEKDQGNGLIQRKVTGREKKPSVMILISGGGTNMRAILEKEQELAEDCPFQVDLVIADRCAKGLAVARGFGKETVCLSRKDPDFVKDLIQATASADLIVLAGFLSILPKGMIEQHASHILNIHPSLLPKFGGRGMYGHHVHEAVLRAGESESGCTVHLVEEGVDTGRILLQKRVACKPGDGPEELAKRVLEREHEAIVEGLLLRCEQWKRGEL